MKDVEIHKIIVPLVYQEYPRCLHGVGGTTLLVHDDDTRDAKLAEGWSLQPCVASCLPAPVVAVSVSDVALEPVLQAEPPPQARRGRPRKDAV